jgi:hypothetical protein
MRARILAVDRTSLALGILFVLASAFYIWTAVTSFPLIFDEEGLDRYNLLATAFLHLRLSVGPAPISLLRLSEPYNPVQNGYLVAAEGFRDEVLYGGQLYLLWGPAPALVLLVPMHLLGLEPSPSATVPFFAVIGLGFSLATLRLLLRVIGRVAPWMSILAGISVALCSVMPFLLRTPSETADTIAGGFCFAMAGIWLAASACARREASLLRLALTSLCFGLAAGSRATLALIAVVLIPLYLTLRASMPRRGLRAALIIPVGICFLLLLGYNQARFGDPLEFGFRHQLAGYDPLSAPLSTLSNTPPGVWYYAFSPPRPLALFPFVSLTQPLLYPGGLPANYAAPDMSGGLLPMLPIVVLLPTLLWIWRRRSTWLGPLALPLLALACAGVGILLLLSYEIFSATERYAVDFSMPLLLGSLAAWLALSRHLAGWRGRLVRVGGGLLVAWGCVMGVVISFAGYGNFLAVEHPGTWAELQDLGSPLSSVITRLAGGPVLAEVVTPHILLNAPAHYTTLGSSVKRFWLEADDRASLVVASPDARTATLVLGVIPSIKHSETHRIETGEGTLGMTLRSPWQAPVNYFIPTAGRVLRISVRLHAGVSRFELSPIASTMTFPDSRAPTLSSVMLVSGLSLTGDQH